MRPRMTAIIPLPFMLHIFEAGLCSRPDIKSVAELWEIYVESTIKGKSEGTIFSPRSFRPLRMPADVYDGYTSRPEIHMPIPISVGNMRRGYNSLILFIKTPHKKLYI